MEQGIAWVKLREQPALLTQAAVWFASKWRIPAETYRESMLSCIRRRTGVPQWYMALNERREIIAGAGVIENDFHERRDLRPNLCALYVEPAYRGRGLGRAMLDFARRDMGGMGEDTLYLLTDHTDLYEACGWTFVAMAREENGGAARVYAAPTIQT